RPDLAADRPSSRRPPLIPCADILNHPVTDRAWFRPEGVLDRSTVPEDPVRERPMFGLRRLLSRCANPAHRPPRRPKSPPPPRNPRPALEPLEDRCLFALLGLAQATTPPDITSGALTNLSFALAGNNANPFHYDSIPLWLTTGDGSVQYISDPS